MLDKTLQGVSHKWDGVWCLTRLPKWVCTTLSQASRIAQEELMERQIIELTWMVGWSILIKNTSSACLLPEKSKFRTLLGQYLGSFWERCFSFFVAFYEKLWYQNSVWFWSCMFPSRLYLRIIHFTRIDCLIPNSVFVFSVFLGLYNPDLMQQFAWGSRSEANTAAPRFLRSNNNNNNLMRSNSSMIKLVLLGDGKRWGDPFMCIPMTHSFISSLLFSYVTIYQFLTKIFFFFFFTGEGN